VPLTVLKSLNSIPPGTRPRARVLCHQANERSLLAVGPDHVQYFFSDYFGGHVDFPPLSTFARIKGR